MGIRVKLTRSGGLAGLSMVADVDLDDLPDATAEKVRAALRKVDFDVPAASPSRPGMPDAFQYDLVVGNGGRRTLTARDPVASPGLQALLAVLLPLARPE